ncbi:mycothiol-dependent nitroreductase Rv2466c family protein [Nocardia vaccinii]|uniref:mycothiol-dependent nitroreductase Rv2466c family protein n=1 Tax=Nocardia vaccinii TaxID=1822 RepID=UPI00082CB28D|nr:disulfide bond formation protein DsbA [Nocardia vaccinii]
MTEIELYVDPVCPFGWVTTQWATTASDTADTKLTLRQMSLAVLNEGEDLAENQRAMMDRSRRLGRVFAAVTDRYGTGGFARLYQELGARIHVRREPATEQTIEAALGELGMDPALGRALDDEALDDAVARTHEAGQQALGDRGGCPISVFDGRGLFGPVLTEIPSPQQGLTLLRALIDIAATPAFATVQRPHSGPPKIYA